MKESNLKNVKREPVKIEMELDKKRTLLFDFNAFSVLEDIYKPFEETIADIQNKKSIKALTALIHSSLVHEDENLTLKQTGAMFGFHNIQEVHDKIQKAMKFSFPDKDDSEEKNATLPA